MKKIIAIIVLLSVMCGCFACQPTPTTPPVISKNDGALEQAIYEGADADYVYEAPESFDLVKQYAGKGEITCKGTTVSVLKDTGYAVYNAKPKQFTAEDFSVIADICFPGAEVTCHLDTFSRDDIYKYMLSPLEKELWELENGEYKLPDVNVADVEGETWDEERLLKETKKSTKKALSRVREMYDNAPDAVTGEAFDLSDYETGTPLSLDMTMKDGTVGRLYYVCNGMNSRLDVSFGEYMIEHTSKGSIGLSDLTDGHSSGTGAGSVNVKVTKKEALKAADSFMRKMGIYNDFGFCMHTQATAYTMSRLMEVGSEWDYDRLHDVIYAGGKAYRGVIYTRSVNGVPFADFSVFSRAENDEYGNQSFIYERFIVWVGENGVAGFSWDAPLETAPVQKSVVLAPFAEVKERICEGLYRRCAGGYSLMMWVPYGTNGDGYEEEVNYPLEKMNASICSLELRYMQVLKKDAEGEFLLLPVWCAYCDSASAEYTGYSFGDSENKDLYMPVELNEVVEVMTDKTTQRVPAVVLNAVDLSTISVKKGY